MISSCGSPLNRIAELLHFYLLPEVKKSPAYLKDTADTIRKIENLVLPDNVLLASIDIISMFTAVYQKDAYDTAMKKLARVYLEKHDPPIPSMHYISKMLKLVLYRNAFEFNGEFYLQIAGCPIGLRSSPSLCCLVENELVEKIKSLDERILHVFIYMDDSWVAWGGSLAELDEFIEKINKLSETIKFTYTASETEVQFLDLMIYKGERFRTTNVLDIKCYTKPMETWCYLDRKSCHNPSVFKGFIRGELIRYARNTSNLGEYENKKNKIPLVFKMNYYPHITSKHIKNALLKHWEIIEDNPELRRIFYEIPIIAFSRTKNLKDDLVRARLKVSREEEEEIGPNIEDSRPGSSTLNMLQDLELESRGLNDNFLPHELFHLDPPIQSSQSQEISEEIETASDEV